MGNISREMEILRQNPKEMLAMKGTVTDVNDAFFINRLDTSEEGSSELTVSSIETSETEKQRGKKKTISNSDRTTQMCKYI
jgi:hypothetical protein